MLPAHVGSRCGCAAEGAHGICCILREYVGLGLRNFSLDGLLPLVPLAGRLMERIWCANALAEGGGGVGGQLLCRCHWDPLEWTVAGWTGHFQHSIQELPIFAAGAVAVVALGIYVHHPGLVDEAWLALNEALPAVLPEGTHALLVCTCALVGCEGMLRAGRERVGVRIGFSRPRRWAGRRAQWRLFRHLPSSSSSCPGPGARGGCLYQQGNAKAPFSACAPQE